MTPAWRLRFAGDTLPLADPTVFGDWVTTLRADDGVVYCKRPFAGPEQVLDYLGRYTHRVALSNDRLVDLTNGIVRFRWKAKADGHRSVCGDAATRFSSTRFYLHG